MSEKPVHSRLRRLADWINLTGAKKVHSLIDKVYKRKNLEMAWEKVEGEPRQWRCGWADSRCLRSAAEPAVGSAASGAERGYLSPSTGSSTPHPEEGQAGRVSHTGRSRGL